MRLAHRQAGLITDLGLGLWAWPLPMDHNGDSLNDLLMLDAEGYLALFKRKRGAGGALTLAPPHVRVDKGGATAKLWLASRQRVYARGFHQAQQRRIETILLELRPS